MRLKILVLLSLSVISGVFSAETLGQRIREVTEVTVEVSPGSIGSNRAFKIILRQDGSAAYHGQAGVALIGKYKGVITKDQYDQLTKLIVTNGFLEMRSRLPSSTAFGGSQNMPMVTSSLVRTSAVVSGKRKTISRATGVKIDEPEQPSKELLEIEFAITSLATKLNWVKTGQ